MTPSALAGRSHHTEKTARTSVKKRCWYSPQNYSRPDAESAGHLKSLVALGYFSEARHQWEAGVWKRREENKGEKCWGEKKVVSCGQLTVSVQTQCLLHTVTQWTGLNFKGHLPFFHAFLFVRIFIKVSYTLRKCIHWKCMAQWVLQCEYGNITSAQMEK